MPTETEFLSLQKAAIDALVASLTQRIGLDLTYRPEVAFTTDLRDAVAKAVQDFRDRRSDIAGTARTAGSQPAAGSPSNPIRAEGAYLNAIRSPLVTVQSSLATRLGGDMTNRTEDQYLASIISSLNSANASLNTRLVELGTSGYSGSISYADPGVTHAPGTEPAATTWLDRVGVFSPFSAYATKLPAYEQWKGRRTSPISDNCHEGFAKDTVLADGTKITPGSDWDGPLGIVHNVQTAAWSYGGIERDWIFAIVFVPKSCMDDPERFDRVLRGDFDAAYRSMAQALVPAIDRRFPSGFVAKLLLRIWEINGKWMAGWGGPDTDPIMQMKCRAAQNYFIRFFKAIDPRFEFDWCPTVGKQSGTSTWNVMPDPTLLVSLGTDVYDEAWSTAHRVSDTMTTAQKEAIWTARFNTTLRDGVFGLTTFARVAARFGLKRTFAEFGCRNQPTGMDQGPNGGDNYIFIRLMAEHFRALDRGDFPGTSFGSACYFERADARSALSRGNAVTPATNPPTYQPTEFPLAAEEFLRQFGPNAAP